MAKERKKVKEEKRFIPLHFATFGDMMMNMLTLFILLCSFAKEQRAKFFAAGIGSFIQAIESHGLPGLLPSDTDVFMREYHDDKYRALQELIEEEDAARMERDQTEHDSMDKIEIEDIPNKGETWIPGAIQFPRGSSYLDKNERAWLKEQLVFLRGGKFQIEIVGHAWSECSDDEASWKLSQNRAYTVLSYLNEVGGIPLERMHAMAHSTFQPLAEGEKDPGLNRRVNIKLTKSR